jgi:hypothetical protein
MILKIIVQVTTTVLLLAVIIATGCSSQRSRVSTTVVVNESPIIAMVGTRKIRREDLWSSLIELGGKTAFEEFVLTIALELTLQVQGIDITQQDIDNERVLFSTSLPTEQEDAVDEILELKGFGAHRKSALFFRNAALRKLISPDVHITTSAKKRMFSIIYGVSYPARIIVVSSLNQATGIRTTLADGASFQTTAIEYSIDPSGVRGGTVNPINVADPIWPAAIRDVIHKLSLNEISQPILVDDKWVIIQLTGPPVISDAVYEEVESEMYRLSKLSQERFLMKQLSSSLVEKHTPTVFDNDLKKSLRSLGGYPE